MRFMRIGLIACALCLTLGIGSSAFSQNTPVARPLSPACIGFIGTAEIHYLAPAHLIEAAKQMSFARKDYDKATVAFRQELERKPESKIAFIALCQLDPEFREKQYVEWKDRITGDAMGLFRKGVSLYLHHMAYIMYNPNIGFTRSEVIGRHYEALRSPEKGPLPLFEKLWELEPDMVNGILLAAICTQLHLKKGPADTDFLARLIQIAVGTQVAEQYRWAREKNWPLELPDVANLDRTQTSHLIAVITNRMSLVGTVTLKNGDDKVGYDSNGKVLAAFSKEMNDFVFTPHTEARFLYDWRKKLKAHLGK